MASCYCGAPTNLQDVSCETTNCQGTYHPECVLQAMLNEAFGEQAVDKRCRSCGIVPRVQYLIDEIKSQSRRQCGMILSILLDIIWANNNIERENLMDQVPLAFESLQRLDELSTEAERKYYLSS